MNLKNLYVRLVVRSIVTFFNFFKYYTTKKKVTSQRAYFSLLDLFCLTGGKSNDFFSKIVSIINPPKLIFNQNYNRSFISEKEIEPCVKNVDANGYSILDVKLPNNLLEDLVEFALNTKCRPRETDKEVEQGFKNELIPVYPKNNQQHVRYDFSTSDLLKLKTVQKLITDPCILAIAQKYLNATPILDIVTMWWQAASRSEPDKEAAQYFHFDFDRIKWVKFFFYLTDVGANNGPHCFIQKSHKTNGIPSQLLSKNYVRLTDEEVFQYYDRNDQIEFCGAKGTIIVEDTRGLHKGKHVIENDRLIFQLQFTNSLFGSNYPRCSLPKDFFNDPYINNNNLQSVFEFFQ